MSNDIVKTKKGNRLDSSNVDILQILRLKYYNRLSHREIAEKMGINVNTVVNSLSTIKKLLKEPATLRAYEGIRNQILSSAEMLLLEQIFDKEKLQKASINNVAYAFQQIFNARRLEEGQSTENISYADMSKRLEEIKEEIRKKKEQLVLETHHEPTNTPAHT